jgi:crossover junction endodeoxyribonuclease RuvC|tara:strand:+ start:3556 stop:4041 length:486 start_codon:yes stop_codon:yes gene_type:complete
MIIIGIDPGVSGAICILTDGKITEIYEMPTMIDGKKNKKQVNGAEVTNIINKELVNEKDINVVIEHVSAMPGQGVTSMFNFGQSFGVLKGICAALKLPVHFIRPVKWKKHFNLINTEKDASRTKVIEVFPYISSKISKKKDANKADAILIARFFHETVGNS